MGLESVMKIQKQKADENGKNQALQLTRTRKSHWPAIANRLIFYWIFSCHWRDGGMILCAESIACVKVTCVTGTPFPPIHVYQQ